MRRAAETRVGVVPERASLSTACVQRHSRPLGRGVSRCPLYAVARSIVGSWLSVRAKRGILAIAVEGLVSRPGHQGFLASLGMTKRSRFPLAVPSVTVHK